MRRKERKMADIQSIESVFSTADVCRVAFADNNTPYIVAMNFGYMLGPRNVLYFHCASEGKKIDMLQKNDYVCFQLDCEHNYYKGSKACGWGMRYKSVVGYGTISIIKDLTERKKALDLLMDHYGGDGVYDYDDKELVRTTILRLEISEMTGKQA
jgi:nitroimidazol reductase NimA-like FMN-containing flavoprotein (pyridoxamine 5'-phosphate oxidase superfamily)